jgi:hypothetical protein
MTSANDFETFLTDEMRTSAATIVATPDFQRRLIERPPATRPRRLRTAPKLFTAQILSVAAAVILVLAVTAVVSFHWTGSPSPGATHTDALGNPAACSEPLGDAYQPTTTQDFTSHIVGVWVACSQPSIFDTHDAGLEIDANGEFEKLIRDSSGQLAATSGYQNSGTWTATDSSAMNGRPTFQIDFALAGNGGFSTVPQFAGTTMRLDNNGSHSTRYARTTAAAAPPASTGPGETACSTAGKKVYSPTTIEDFTNRFLGTWLACNKPSIFNTDDAGLQINSDHHWTKLVRGVGNKLVAASGPRSGGTWEIIDGPTQFQLNLTVAGAGTVITVPVFVGTAMLMNNEGMLATTYVPAS